MRNSKYEVAALWAPSRAPQPAQQGVGVVVSRASRWDNPQGPAQSLLCHQWLVGIFCRWIISGDSSCDGAGCSPCQVWLPTL